MLDEERKKREASTRPKRCPSLSCHEMLSTHTFGKPSRLCPGRTTAGLPESTTVPTAQSERRRKTKTPDAPVALAPSSSSFLASSPATATHLLKLKKQLASMEREEQMLIQSLKDDEQTILQQISEREASLAKLRGLASTSTSSPSTQAHRVAPTPSLIGIDQLLKDGAPTLHNPLRQDISPLTAAPFSHPLEEHQQIGAPGLPPQQRSLAELYRHQEQRSSELFLRPSRTSATGQGKPLRVVDFVSRLRPQEDEKILTTTSGEETKLLLSLGHKKPNLDNITVEQYAIANIRIFYELLSSNRLPTSADLRDYLSFSIKVFELARNYTWESVLKYDDEYRILQHTYGYPWSFDNSHLHEVMLIPRWAVNHRGLGVGVGSFTRKVIGSNNSPSTVSGTNTNYSYGTHTIGGMEICRNFNRQKGCVKIGCKFAHVCNRKLAHNRICEKSHPGWQHMVQGRED